LIPYILNLIGAKILKEDEANSLRKEEDIIFTFDNHLEMKDRTIYIFEFGIHPTTNDVKTKYEKKKNDNYGIDYIGKCKIIYFATFIFNEQRKGRKRKVNILRQCYAVKDYGGEDEEVLFHYDKNKK